MTETSPRPASQELRPASQDEITQSLSFALRYDGRRRVRDADDAMARITAERLVKHLESSGFVLMKRPPASAPAVGSTASPARPKIPPLTEPARDPDTSV
jgi:hypothetical protein